MSSTINLLSAGGTGDFRDPGISPQGPRAAEPLPDDVVTRNAELVERWAAKLYDAPAEDILDFAREHTPGAAVITLSMENTVLAELAQDHLPDADFLFLDTEYHFPETLSVADAVERRYPNRLVRTKAILSRAEQDATYGPMLYTRDPNACCRMRKVEPLQRHLSPYAAVVDGLRRVDGPTRAQAPALSLNKTGRLKISPIITWTLADTEAFIAERDLIVHPLTRQGYPSIGCATCTLPVAKGQDPRAGRWSGSGKTECGLHV
ncbi:phosphoadenylyl-sulfate reductase [Corynebacterium uterequi]|uniref:Adenosine 5'-phosphosulfate reductase n=1 Tax=Corynebacterium uterequi TaxID=1072256 RepID=A0A0G3HLG0_9CORY|nr:phosphoadenylyl-sulfate reductase [Corynebacterium uterequi]AKK11972.1 thioredoxin-dependent phosophoadenylyl-sulfate reductase [Corynebacterium uterequi]